jgi:succinate dehydrogenase / fumarate reductase, iron-sulfur subunit
MKITFQVQRYDPERDLSPHLEDYEVELEPESKVLDGLLYIKANLDGGLAFRRSCAHGICGSDAMLIDGQERLACKTLLRDLGTASGGRVRVEPLKGLPLQRDLMVDQGKFFANYRSVKPYLINEEPPPAKERLQSQAEREGIDDATKCILCGSCYSACPVIREKNPLFIGPAAILNAARFAFDSRDRGLAERLPALDGPDGARACENKFRCTLVCPRGIKVTKSINATKALISKRAAGAG